MHDGLADDIKAILSRIETAWGGAVFARRIDATARGFVESLYKIAHRSLGINVYSSERMRDVIETATRLNAQLIKSVSEEHLNALAGIVYRGIQAGTRASEIEAEIGQYAPTQARARLIARDQTAKVMGAINRADQLDHGVKYFRWVTANDERVRPSHMAAQNRMTPYGRGVYRWDDPPLIDGVPSLPTQPINCRCHAEAVWDFEVEDFQKGKGKK